MGPRAVSASGGISGKGLDASSPRLSSGNGTVAGAASSARTSPLDTLAGETLLDHCTTAPSQHSLLIEGDGAPQRLSEGAPLPPRSLRSCAPIAYSSRGKLTVAACATRQEARRSCLWADAEAGVYFDRTGAFAKLDIRQWTVRQEGDSAKGSFLAVEQPAAGKAPRSLRVQFHVSTQQLLVAQPGVWEGKGAWSEL